MCLMQYAPGNTVETPEQREEAYQKHQTHGFQEIILNSLDAGTAEVFGQEEFQALQKAVQAEISTEKLGPKPSGGTEASGSSPTHQAT